MVAGPHRMIATAAKAEIQDRFTRPAFVSMSVTVPIQRSGELRRCEVRVRLQGDRHGGLARGFHDFAKPSVEIAARIVDVRNEPQKYWS